jgi:YHS domain-containing protein
VSVATIAAPDEIDPVCGMTVTVGSTTPSFNARGRTWWFCSTRCRDRFAADPAAFTTNTYATSESAPTGPTKVG